MYLFILTEIGTLIVFEKEKYKKFDSTVGVPIYFYNYMQPNKKKLSPYRYTYGNSTFVALILTYEELILIHPEANNLILFKDKNYPFDINSDTNIENNEIYLFLYKVKKYYEIRNSTRILRSILQQNIEFNKTINNLNLKEYYY